MIRLITGGARSGKSKFAEDIFNNKKDVVYIATSVVSDLEMEDRVRVHRQDRDSSWRTYEAYRALYRAIDYETYYILDCITIMISNIMFSKTEGLDRIPLELQYEIENEVIYEIERLIENIKKHDLELNIVTNEIGLGIVPDHHISRVFRDIQGRVNQKIAGLSDEVYLLVSGIGVRIK